MTQRLADARINVFVVDDHAIVREGWKQILAETPDIRVTGEASNGLEALDRIRKGEWDVMILDLDLPGKHGLDVLKDIRRIKPKMPVLILSIFSEEDYALRTLRAGAAGFLNKRTAPDELIDAVRKVHAGGKYVSAGLAEKMAFFLDSTVDKPSHEKLSDREFQVLCMLGAGKTVKEIAEELILSTKTISTFRARILEKMGLSRDAELIHYVLKHGLIEATPHG